MLTVKCISPSQQSAEKFWAENQQADIICPPAILPGYVNNVEPEMKPDDPDRPSFFVPSGYPEIVPEGDKNGLTAAPPILPFGDPQLTPYTPQYFLPFWNIGLWQYKNADTGQINACTAFFVCNNNLLMTAAHCVISQRTGQWHSEFRFIRAYDKRDSTPQVIYPRRICIYAEAFTNRFNPQYDYAVIRTSTPGGAGWLGFDTVINQSVVSVGYPTCFGGNPNNPDCFDGGGRVPSNLGSMYYDAGSFFAPLNGVRQMTYNPMQRGISGGPIIKNFNTQTSAGGNNIAVGLNSFGPYIGTVSSPEFTEDTYKLFEAASS